MKKIIIMFIGIVLSVIPYSVKADELDTLVRWDLDMSIVTHMITNGNDYMTNLILRTGNGILAYCIEPGKNTINNLMHNSTINISDTNIGNIDTSTLNLIGYYGYNYEGHTDIKYYMATQELIWRHMKVDDVYYTYGKYGDKIDLSSYKNEILSLVNNHYKAPSFNFLNKYVLGEKVIVEDFNDVLSGYELDGIYNNIRIDGNKIIINILDKDNNFKLKRKDTNVSTKYFYRDNYQTVASFGNPNNVSKEYNINYTYGNITVNVLDYDTKENVPSTKESSLEHAKYALYDESGNELSIKETNELGIIVFDKLSKGIYTVKELEPSKGYMIDQSSYKVFIHSYNKDINVKSYEKVIKNSIPIEDKLDTNENIEEPIKDVLPKTGKNINYIYVLALLLVLGIYYEKKYL